MDQLIAHIGGTRTLKRAALVALALLATLALMDLITLLATERRPDTGLAFGQDFKIYFDACKEALAGGDPYAPYSIGTSFLYHPGALTLVSLFAWMQYGHALWSFATAATLAWVWTVALILTVIARAHPEANRLALAGVAAALLVLGPAMQTIYLGQVNSFVALATTAAFLLSERRRPLGAGAALSVAIVLKTSPVLLLAYFLALRRWREVASTVACLVAFTAVAAAQFGGGVVGDWIDTQRVVGRDPAASYPNDSLVSVIARALHDVIGTGSGAARALLTLDKVLLVVLAVALVALLLRARPAAARDRLAFFCAFLTLSVVASPLVWFHHGVLLALPLAMLLFRSARAALAGIAAVVLIELEPVWARAFDSGLPMGAALLVTAAAVLAVTAASTPLAAGARLRLARTRTVGQAGTRP